MVGIDGPSIHVGTDQVASVLLGLDGRVVVILADALMVGWIDEQRPVALVRLAMVDGGGRRRLALRQAAFA